MIRTKAILAVTAAASLAAGCGSSSSGGSSSTGTPNPAQAGHVAGCKTPPPLQKKHQSYAHEPAMTIKPTTYIATIVTNCGTIKLSLDAKAAPHTVNSFAFLARKHFFDDSACHRLTEAAQTGIAVLQCGDPTSTGYGGPGYKLPDENLSGASYTVGTVAMANSGPNTGGSQFFLIYGPSQLSDAYTPFGHVTSGIDLIQRIAAAGTDNKFGAGDGGPNQPVVIESFTVAKG
jgi:peptidyl-prolyl cis-trans isomerase B (cyclophilin B)